MPETRPIAATVRRAPLGLIGLILIVWAVEGAVSRHKRLVTEASPASWLYSRDQSGREARRADLLCLGSSLIKFGVYPSAVERASGLSAFNLSVYTGRVASSYYVLKKAIDAGARPKAVVVDCHDGPHARGASRAESLTSNLRNWPELLSARDCVELAWVARDAEFFAATMTARALPSLNSRHELRTALRHAFSAQPDPGPEAVAALLRNWNQNRGTQVHANVTPGADVPPPPDVRRWAPPVKLSASAVRPDPVLNTYFRRLLNLAERHQITVFWVMPPLPDSLQTHQDRDGSTDYIDTQAAGLLSGHDNLVVVDGRRTSYPLRAFCDGKHLNRVGGLAFSSDLGEVVRRHLSDPSPSTRVYRLPRFTERGQGDDLEDINQSMLAVRSLGTLRK